MSSFPAIPGPPFLTGADRRWLGEAAVLALCRHFLVPDRDTHPAVDPGGPAPGVASLRAGVFVTLFSGEELRGCLGSLSGSEPLGKAIPRLAVASATRDARFSPLCAEELAVLRIEVTLLGEPTRLPADPVTILAGLRPEEHGIQVRLGSSSGLFLPQVARRYGWSARELLEQTCRKAGLDAGAWKAPPAEVLAFRASSLDARCPGLGSGGEEPTG